MDFSSANRDMYLDLFVPQRRFQSCIVCTILLCVSTLLSVTGHAEESELPADSDDTPIVSDGSEKVISSAPSTTKLQTTSYTDQRHSIDIVASENKFNLITCQLGNLDFEKDVRITFTIRNMTSRLLKLRSIATSCNCTKADIPAKELKVDESTQGMVVFPTSKLRGSRGLSLDLLCDGDVERVTVFMSASLSNAALFAEPLLSISMPEERSSRIANAVKLEVPLVITPDLTAKDIAFEFPSELLVQTYKIEKRGDRDVLVFQIPAGALNSVESLQGVVTITNLKSGRKESIPLRMRSEGLVELNPASITLVRHEDRPHVVIGQAILRIRSTPDVVGAILSEQPKEEAPELLSIAFEHNTSVQVSSVRIGRGIYRLEFSLAEKEQPDLSKPLNLLVETSQAITDVAIQLNLL